MFATVLCRDICSKITNKYPGITYMNRNLKLNILVVEDEKSIATVMSYNLQKEGFNVQIIENGKDALEQAQASPPDLIILDWILPIKNGMEVLVELRRNLRTANVPVIMISAKDQDLDKVEGLGHGADDYVSKPFSPIELIARVKAVLRRIRPAFADRAINFYDIDMDMNTCSVSRNGKDIDLAPIEFKILQSMMEQPNVVLSRMDLVKKIWSGDAEVDPRTVDVHITRLRKALLSASADDIDVIKTIRLQGYKLQLPRKVRFGNIQPNG